MQESCWWWQCDVRDLLGSRSVPTSSETADWLGVKQLESDAESGTKAVATNNPRVLSGDRNKEAVRKRGPVWNTLSL